MLPNRSGAWDGQEEWAFPAGVVGSTGERAFTKLPGEEGWTTGEKDGRNALDKDGAWHGPGHLGP